MLDWKGGDWSCR